MSRVVYRDKKEYETMELIRMQNNRSYHKSLFVNEHIFTETQNKFHRHEYMQIDYIAKGNGYIQFEDGIYEFAPGSCFIIPPYVPHKIILGKNFEKISVYEVEFLVDFIFPPSHEISDMEAYADIISLGLKENTSPENSKHILNLTGSIREKVELIISEALSEYKNREIGYETVLHSLILHLLTVMGREFSKNDSTEKVKKHRNEILKSIEYIHQNYEKNITLDSVSQFVNYSSSYFSTIFKSVTSRNFVEYLTNYRIKKSMELLKNTDMRVIDIASSVGFENVTNFNRVFKKFIGLSPVQYRKLD